MSITHTFCLLLVASSLWACTPDQQDLSQSQKQLVAISTSASGHRIAGAVVFIDDDRDGELDSLEPFALSNHQGQTQSDPALCQPDATGRRPSDCLVIPAGRPPAMLLRARGGFDIEAGAVFVGELAAEVAPGAAQSSGSAVPVLNNLQALRAAAESVAVDLRTGDEILLQALVGAFVAKVAAETDDSTGLSNLAGAVLSEVGADLLAPNPQGETRTLVQLIAEVGNVRGWTRRVLDQHQPSLSGQAEDIAAIVQSVAGAVNAMNAIQPSRNLGLVRAAHLMVLKAGRRGGNRTQVENDAAYFTRPQGSDTPAEFLNQLNIGEFDLDRLQLASLSGDGARLADVARLPATAPGLENIAGGFIEASRRDADVDARVLAFFDAAAGATNGDLRLCIRFLSTSARHRGETEGALLQGEWRLLGPRRVLLVPDEFGLSEGTLLSVLAPEPGDRGAQRYRLHYGGQSTELSGFAVRPSAERPATNEQCAVLLGG